MATWHEHNSNLQGVEKISAEVFLSTFNALKNANLPQDKRDKLTEIEHAFRAGNFTDKAKVMLNLVTLFGQNQVVEVMNAIQHRHQQQQHQQHQAAQAAQASSSAAAAKHLQQQQHQHAMMMQNAAQQQQQQQQQQQAQQQAQQQKQAAPLAAKPGQAGDATQPAAAQPGQAGAAAPQAGAQDMAKFLQLLKVIAGANAGGAGQPGGPAAILATLQAAAARLPGNAAGQTSGARPPQAQPAGAAAGTAAQPSMDVQRLKILDALVRTFSGRDPKQVLHQALMARLKGAQGGAPGQVRFPLGPGGLFPRQISEDERLAEEDRNYIVTYNTLALAAEKEDEAQGALPAAPFYTIGRLQSDYVLNQVPTMHLLTDLAKKQGIKAVSPACYDYLSLAVEEHMKYLVTRMCDAAKQRTDPARDLPSMQRTGPNVRQGVGLIAKADKQARERRQAVEQEKRMALVQAKRKKLDEESKELVAAEKKKQAMVKAIGQASGALGQAFSFKDKKKKSTLGAGAKGEAGAKGDAAAGGGDAAAAAGDKAGAAAPKGLRGSFASKLKGTTGQVLGKKDAGGGGGGAGSGTVKKEAGAGKSKEGKDKEGGEGEAAPARPKKKAKTAAAAAGETGKTAAATAATGAPADQAAAGGSAGGKAGAAGGAEVAAARPAVRAEPVKEEAAAPAPAVLSATSSAAVNAMLKREAEARRHVELSTRDLLTVLERDPLLSKQQVIWKVYGELAIDKRGGVETS